MAAFSTAVNAYYVYSRNWISCNMLGLAFATNAIQLLALDSFATGMILLMGLFFYDIFWVFGTDVMVTVARKFDAPVKVVFPRDLWAKEWHFAMLGLGDIVIPGVFIALCLRFDYHLALKRLRGEVPVGSQRYYSFPRTYFYTSFGAYVIGLLTTVTVMHVTGAAQPALLYLSPACISSVLLIAAVRGELKEFWSYSAEVKAVEDDVSLTENIINRVLDSPDSVSSATLLTTSKKTTLVQKTTTIRRVPSAEDEDYADAGAEADASDDEASTSSSAGNLSSKGRKKKSPKKSLKKN